jgi:hypothetical protein
MQPPAATTALALALAAAVLATGCGGERSMAPRPATLAHSGAPAAAPSTFYAKSGAYPRAVSCEEERQEKLKRGDLLAALTGCP